MSTWVTDKSVTPVWEMCYNVTAMAGYLPFFWDYKLTEKDLKEILASGDEIKKRWAIARLVESAPFEEIWNYISLKELQKDFPHLKLKKPIRAVWRKALKVWSR